MPADFILAVLLIHIIFKIFCRYINDTTGFEIPSLGCIKKFPVLSATMVELGSAGTNGGDDHFMKFFKVVLKRGDVG
ncbi:MAG: hypothetical protein ACXWV8_11400 [Chitinophagaceae bacterium]